MHLQKQLSLLLVLAGFAAVAVGCGRVQDLVANKHRLAPFDPDPYPRATIVPEPRRATPAALAATPLLTRLAIGTEIPARLRATSLRVSVTANDPLASFDCQTGGQSSWVACNAGAGYDFGRLVHSKNYSVAIRAHGADGRVDANPVSVSFFVDMLGGESPALPGTPRSLADSIVLPTSVADLPVAVQPSTPAALVSQSRFLQVGAYYAMTVPGNAVVAGYATDKTYNGITHSLLLMPSGGTIIGNNGVCTASYQRLVTAGDGASYCDATPSSSDQVAAGIAALPRNFLEIALNPSSGLHEALFAAALDGAKSGAAEDLAVGRISIKERCQGAASAGQSPIPLLNQFYAGSAQTQTLVWCRTKAASGRSQWLGLVQAVLTADPAGPALRIIYAVDIGQQVITSNQFIERVSVILRRQLTAIAPIGPSA